MRLYQNLKLSLLFEILLVFEHKFGRLSRDSLLLESPVCHVLGSELMLNQSIIISVGTAWNNKGGDNNLTLGPSGYLSLAILIFAHQLQWLRYSGPAGLASLRACFGDEFVESCFKEDHKNQITQT